MRKVLLVVCCMLLLACKAHCERQTTLSPSAPQYVAGEDFIQALHLIDSTFKAQSQDMQELRQLCVDCVTEVETERLRSRIAIATGFTALAVSCVFAFYGAVR